MIGMLVKVGLRVLRPAVARTTRQLEQLERAGADEIRAVQLTKLNRLLASHLQRDFYRQLCESAGWTGQPLESVEQLSRLPIVTKAFLREHLKSLAVMASGWRLNSTSGSSGQNLQFYQSRSMVDARTAAVAFCYRWAGIDFWSNRKISVWGYSPPTRLRARVAQQLKCFALRVANLQGYGLDDVAAAHYLEFIGKYKPALLEGYPSYLHRLAETGRRRGIRPFVPRAIISSGEQLQGHQREAIESYFGKRLYNRYGSREFGVIAHERDDHDGLWSPVTRFILETGPGGELLVTDLDNFASPFIRYAIGDLATVAFEDDRLGRSGPRITGLGGRVHDVIASPSGKTLPGQFWTLMSRSVPGIEEFQAVQTSQSHVEFRIKVSPDYDPHHECHLQEHLREITGDEMTMAIVRVDHIDATAMGKRRFVIRLES